jgi:hypothetical protein
MEREIKARVKNSHKTLSISVLESITFAVVTTNHQCAFVLQINYKYKAAKHYSSWTSHALKPLLNTSGIELDT